MEQFAVIDFETDGLSPDLGARALAIAVVLVRDGTIMDRYHSLMYSGQPIDNSVSVVTGITMNMLRDAPTSDQVMREVITLVDGSQLVAHNAAFHKAFWVRECFGVAPAQASRSCVCTKQLAQLAYPALHSYKLADLAAHLGFLIPASASGAQADAEFTAALHLHMQHGRHLHNFSDLIER